MEEISENGTRYAEFYGENVISPLRWRPMFKGG